MEYQHLVFEEFARKVQPAINPFNVFTQSDTGINPAIRAEFAHAVYRFGHSMLTDTVSRTNEDGSPNDMPLIDAFLNPPAYYKNGGSTYTPEQAAGAIVMGMSDQTGNELDEFVTEALRNNLLGLPLDLATINMARAREAGVPSLNNFRKEIYRQTNDSALQPYSSWVDFGLSLKHQNSVVNFMAAYGRHPTITGVNPDGDPATPDDFTPTLQTRRQAAQAIFDQGPGSPPDSADFANSAGAWQNEGGNSKTGLDAVDLWVGGLAESQNLFGGLLGSTFNYVFERQLTDLQDGDRLYYLSRTSGLNLRTQLEGNSFAELVQRNTTAESLKSDPFGTADCEFDLRRPTFTGTGNLITDDPLSGCEEDKVLIRMADGTIRYRQTNTVDPPGINAQNTFMGTNGGDKIWGGVDSDTFWGNDGNDRIEGSDGGDVALGGDGRDIITDSAGDDILKGGPGNDAIDSGPGIDVIMSGSGKDFVNGGLNDNHTFAAEGDDFVIAGDGPDQVFGCSGDDWEEGGNSNDLLQGDCGAPFFDDITEPGHDILIGGSGEDDYDAEGGDDIMVAGPGIERNHGTRGYDWATHARAVEPADSDLTIHINAAPGQLADRFLMTEALSGWDKNDILKGDDWVSVEQDVELHAPWGSNALTNEGIARIHGLDAILEGNTECKTDPQVPGDEGEGGPPASGPPITVCGFLKGNILLGGGGSDLIQGRGADDVIDGDAWLNHRLSVRTNPADPATETRSANAMAELQPDVFAGTLDPANIVAVREIRTTGPDGIDTAVYTGPRADYDVDNRGGGRAFITHARNIPACCADQTGLLKGDGTDTLRNIERLQFADQTVELVNIATNTPPTGTVTLSTTTPAENQAITATRAFDDIDGVNAATIVFTWESETSPGSWAAVGTGATFTPDDAQVGFPLRAVATYTDGDGVLESVTSAATANVANVNDVPTGAAVLSDLTPQETVALSAVTTSIADADGLPATLNHQWQQSGLNGTGAFTNIAGATNTAFTPAQAQVNRALRVVVSYTDLHGTAESFTSAASGVTGDLFIGTAAANTWTGTAGDDVARGGGGNDTLNSVGGMDVVSGDAGDDSVNAGNDDDVIEFSGTGDGFDIVAGGAGTDRVQATASGTVIGLRTIGTVEEVTDSGFGPMLIRGNDAGNTLNFTGAVLTNVVDINGAGGNDTVTGTAGADVIRGGAGVDTIAPGAGSNVVSGDAGDDTINGNGGNDVVQFSGAGDGFDAVTGGPGTDRIEATTADTVIGLRSIATTEEVSANGLTGVRIQGSVAANTLNFTAATLTDIVVIDGAGGNDTLTGSGADDVIRGGAGDDNVNGGNGDDVFEFTGTGDGFDTVNGGAGSDVARATADGTVIGLRSVTALEQITANGFAGVRILGSGVADTLNFSAVALTNIVDVDGAGGNDVLTGTVFADVLLAGAGNDTVNGGAGNDTITGGAGNDSTTGGAGDDTLVYAAGFGADTVPGFDANAAGGQDWLDVRPLGINAGNFGTSVSIAAVPGGTRVTIGANTITLPGVAPATVDQTDFVLAP
jgi:Ca2+-binding RTX toxin-like protein